MAHNAASESPFWLSSSGNSLSLCHELLILCLVFALFSPGICLRPITLPVLLFRGFFLSPTARSSLRGIRVIPTCFAYSLLVPGFFYSSCASSRPIQCSLSDPFTYLHVYVPRPDLCICPLPPPSIHSLCGFRIFFFSFSYLSTGSMKGSALTHWMAIH